MNSKKYLVKFFKAFFSKAYMEQLRNFFLKHTGLRYTAIEKKAGLSPRTITKWMNNHQDLPEKHLPNIVSAIQKEAEAMYIDSKKLSEK